MTLLERTDTKSLWVRACLTDIDGQAHKQADKQAGRQGQTDSQTDGQTDRQTCKSASPKGNCCLAPSASKAMRPLVAAVVYPLGGTIWSTTRPVSCSSDTASKTAEPWGAFTILHINAIWLENCLFCRALDHSRTHVELQCALKRCKMLSLLYM